MRHIHQGTFKTGSGEIISGGTVTVYLAGTTTLATIYTALSGGSADADSAVSSGTDGHWYFYVDELDYLSNQKFKIILSYAGFTSKTYDNITIFPKLATSVVSKTSAYTAVLTDDVILASGTFTITLPAVATTTGKIFQVKNTGTGIITISPNVDGASMTIPPEVTVNIQSDGTIYRNISKPDIYPANAEGAAIASAATTDIWAAYDGATKHITGTTTITSLGTAPQAGCWMKIIFDGALTLTHGANLNLQGTANITTAAGDYAFVYADTTTQMDVIFFRVNGSPVVATLAYGSYTPTLTNVANLDTSSPQESQWLRVGTVVTVSGLFTADVTTAGSAAQFRMSLPIASNFANASECGGTFVSPNAASICGMVSADTTNDQALFDWIQPSTPSNITYSFTFTYRVI